MNLLESNEILQLNDKITSFVLISPNRVDDEDVDIFVVKPPPGPAAHWAALYHQDGSDDAPIAQLRPRIDSITKLCGVCRDGLDYLGYYLDLLKSKGKDHESVKDLPTACLLHTGAKTLQDGEDSRCHLCVLLMANLRVKRLAMESIDQSNIEMCWQSDKPTPTRLHFALTHRGHPRAAKNYWNILKLQLWPSSDMDTALFGMADDGMERHSSTESVQTRDNALQWLNKCQANEDGKHDQCNRSSGDWLPTRLLDVKSAIENSMLRLVQPGDHPDVFGSDRQYITLSHCWGTWGVRELPVLTTDNLSERLKEGLPMSLLPQTFEDAGKVAHWFKVRWLWIDSLCILQNSQDDWQREAIMMYDVYKNALLNISADDSPDSRFGCFRNRDPLAVLPMSLRFPGQEEWKVWLAPDTHAVFEGITDSPLAKRGWVFQERQLSRRVLHFTSHELIWECCAEAPYFASETFPGGAPFKSVFNGKPKFQTQSNLSATGDSSSQLHVAWAKICKEYSGKIFSHVQDKLVALSGLAQEFEVHFPDDTYIAGMWRSTFPHSLLWKSSDRSSPVKIPEAYLAPSWSWLSIDGPISPSHAGSRSEYSLVDIFNVVTTPVFLSKPTASLKDASLTLRCFMRPVEIRPDYEKKPWYMLAMGGGKAHMLFIKDEDGTESSCVDNFHSDAFDYSFDIASDENSGPESVSGYFVPLTLDQPTEHSSLCISGLLVEPVGDDSGMEATNTYRRIGLLRVYGPHCQRIKYQLRKGLEKNQGDWNGLLKCLRATHLDFEKLKRDEEEDFLDTGDDKKDASSDAKEEGDEEEVEDDGLDDKAGASSDVKSEDEEKAIVDDGLAEKLEGLDITVGDDVPAVHAERGVAGKAKVEVDLGSVEALERLYALDGALNASGLKKKFERLVSKEITLI
ncbi:heterokaryon incompatibility protein-domain-containing protein [Apiosordaria backusii]|uniref:Heterokaryon incompatibility protein-domain-containing protein n=1 Tax=Apiosordaria backusii TaxID=314023 RepID=A0AA40BDX4_9PEZI|nr:heterokaryon incompatibility protein-domain-containing protein [Apiosordaria backusii]